jgi:CRP-like cAMP-binding protein
MIEPVVSQLEALATTLRSPISSLCRNGKERRISMVPSQSRPPHIQDNTLLSRFPSSVLRDLTWSLRHIKVDSGHILCDPDQPVKFAYFPTAGMLSIVSIMKDGSSAEIGCVGSEGMAGIETLLGAKRNLRRCIGQVAGSSIRVDIKALRKAFAESEQVRGVLLTYVQRHFREVSQTAACNRVHPVEERLARWLLMTSDRIKSDHLGLTHEFISQMLGVRRSTVTIATGILQDSKLIRYKRGNVEILDRPKLEAVSCECYGLLQDQ